MIKIQQWRNPETEVRMRVQDLSNGDTEIANIPCPQVKPKHLLIQSCTSLVSAEVVIHQKYTQQHTLCAV